MACCTRTKHHQIMETLNHVLHKCKCSHVSRIVIEISQSFNLKTHYLVTMAQQKKKDTDGKPETTTELQTSTPIRLWSASKYLNINTNAKIIEGTTCDGWRNVGLAHAIQAKEKLVVETMALSPRASNGVLYFGVGFATKGVINTNNHTFVGNYRDGWNYHYSGCIYSNGVKGKTYIPVALEQRLRVEMEQYKVAIFIENKQIATDDLTEMFTDNKDKQFYPCLSINGNGCNVQIVDFKIQ
eukprot:208553_1